jgi:hypothetical protein
MNFIINNQEIYQIYSYIILIQGISIIFIVQMPTFFDFKKSTFYVGAEILNSLPPSVTIHKNDKGKFKAALREYLHIHSF